MSSQSPAKDGSIRPDGLPYSVVLTEDQWREKLTPQEYHILREAGTEPPFSGEFTNNSQLGTYSCRACGHELFSSQTKFESHCGWPSFFTPLAGDSVVLLEDRSLGSIRTEVRCAACGGHLGHVFEGEGYDTPTDLRYCINSVSVAFDPIG
jgi:peptide-methionine (R)-S-oxide reductase